jgi:hypothetical protein
MVKDGVNPELLLGGKYGHALHVWDLRTRKHLQTLDLGAEQQMVLELRPAHNPQRAYGFVGVVISLKDLSSSIWMWYLDTTNAHGKNKGEWKVKKVIEIPAEPADAEHLPPLLKGFGAVPPLVTDLNLSLDDRFLYVSCWGTGEMRQYDVSNPHEPKFVGSVHIGGIVRRTSHPSAPDKPLNGAPQMVEVSRDGKRVYLTNSLYTPWDAQFYPDGINGWMTKLDVGPEGGITFDPNFCSSSRTASVRTRYDSRAAMHRPTRSASGDAMHVHQMAPNVAHGVWPWAALLLLGAVHGINPGMGWLFAVALGMQRQERGAVWRALLPLAGGHAAAIAVAAIIVGLVGMALSLDTMKWIVAAVLLAVGVSKLVRTKHHAGAGWRSEAGSLACGRSSWRRRTEQD